MQHNTTAPVETMPGVFQDLPFYTAGLRDLPAVFFYLLISVVMHAIIQEYLLDKVNKKLHLSKVKCNKFNESGQLLAFYLVSLFWGGDLLLRENLLSVSSIWEGYPHNNMTFLFKFYFIIQISYWLHIFPELYFQKTKKEEMGEKIQYAVLYPVFIGAAYAFRFTRLALVLLVIHYLSEAVSTCAASSPTPRRPASPTSCSSWVTSCSCWPGSPPSSCLSSPSGLVWPSFPLSSNLWMSPGETSTLASSGSTLSLLSASSRPGSCGTLLFSSSREQGRPSLHPALAPDPPARRGRPSRRRPRQERRRRRTVTFLRLTRRKTIKGMMDLSVMDITHHCVT